MANQFTQAVKHIGTWTASAFLLATIGCAFPTGQFGGDPMLGNFNRPIAATPPVWSGGDPGHSPSYDGQAHMGLNSPDVLSPSATQRKERPMIVPTYNGGLGLFRSSGATGAGSGSASPQGASLGNTGSDSSSSKDSTSNKNQKTKNIAGAKLPSDQSSANEPAVAGGPSSPLNPNSVSFRTPLTGASLTSGANIEPYIPKKKSYVAVDLTKDPASIASVEEGQALLRTCGAKFQRLEQQPTGEWNFRCTMGPSGDNRSYEAKNGDQLEAIRAVMFQIQNDK